MRSVAVLAVVALLAVTLAGCSQDPVRYPNGVPSSSSRSHAASSSASRSSSSTTTTAGPGNGTTGPTANLTAAPANGTAPLNVTLTLSGNVSAGNLTWTLLYGDGNVTNGTTLPATLVHAYTGGGNFTPTLTVSDGSRNATATARVTVAPGSAGFAPGMDPNCQRPDAVAVPPAGGAAYYFDNRLPDSQWIYQESNHIPGLQLTQEPGTAPPPAGGPGDVDPLAVQYNCQNGDTLIA